MWVSVYRQIATERGRRFSAIDRRSFATAIDLMAPALSMNVGLPGKALADSAHHRRTETRTSGYERGTAKVILLV